MEERTQRGARAGDALPTSTREQTIKQTNQRLNNQTIETLGGNAD